MLAGVLFAVAEMEQETRRERQRAGIEAARKRGVCRGRKPGSTKADPKQARKLRKKGLTRRHQEKPNTRPKHKARYAPNVKATPQKPQKPSRPAQDRAPLARKRGIVGKNGLLRFAWPMNGGLPKEARVCGVKRQPAAR